MRTSMRILIRSLILGSVILASGCVVEPVGHGYYHCGYYHCR